VLHYLLYILLAYITLIYVTNIIRENIFITIEGCSTIQIAIIMDEKVKTLELELQHVREENNTLRFMLEVMKIKCTNLESHLQEINKEEHKEIINSNQFGLLSNFDTRKRARLEHFPTAKKPLQVFVKTHPNDESLVSMHH
ncbi:hypothetical protein KIW84_060704, partial [Lathyrus oleraceus]